MAVLKQNQCATCPIGKEMRVGGGGFCPYLEEVRNAGDHVFKEGQRADSSWFLKDGTLKLVDREGMTQELDAPQSDLGASRISDGLYGVSAIAISDIQLCRRPMTWVSPWHDDNQKGDKP